MILNHAGEFDNDINAKEIAKAFNGSEGDVYCIDYSDELELNLDSVCLESIGADDFLCVYRQERSGNGRKRFTIIGRFDSEGAKNDAYEKGEFVTSERFSKTVKYPLTDTTKETLQKMLGKKRVYSNTSKPSKKEASTSGARAKRLKKQCDSKEQDANADAEAKVDLIKELETKYNMTVAEYNAAKDALLTKRAEMERALVELSAAKSPHLTTETAINLIQDENEMEVDITDTEQSFPSTVNEADGSGTATQAADGDGILYFTYNGIAGSMRFGGHDILLVKDLQSNSQSVDVTAKGYTLRKFGKNDPLMAWVPNRCELIVKTALTKLKKKAEKIDNLIRIFSTNRCILPRRSRNLLAAAGMRACGAGDESKCFVMVLSVKAIFYAIDLDFISNKAIAKGMLSRSSIANDEATLAAMIRVTQRQEMRDDDVKFIGKQSDHGNRKGFEHNVCVDSWVGSDGGNGLRLKTHVTGTGHTGETAKNTAQGMKKAAHGFYNFTRLDNEAADHIFLI